ncbi:MAG: thrombospondin type 3 repeat-containing protein [Candidatus Moranbacteria bacterium]|nr:thrombospondin type 3 repeat-containing protein [Candidatus Moranbacteria bacterium]
MSEQNVRFPQTTSNKWRIIFTYAQPLYISELRLIEDNAIKSNTHAIRFLAQPNHSYRIYYNPDRTTSPPLKEAGNLAFAQDVLVLNTTSQVSNPDYVVADSDTDGVPDTFDNCISMANIDQKDINKNGRGDVCDDFDEDGIVNTKDNCPDNPNRDQQDVDADGIGDTCDTEESRITERHAWIPWAGIGFAAIVLIVLLAVTAKSVYRERNGGV